MQRDQVVALIGDSLLLNAVETSLGGMPGLGVMRLHGAIADVEQHLISLDPDLVIFELGAQQLQFVLPLLKKQPNIPLVGLDTNFSKVVALSSQQHMARTADDLTRVVRMYTHNRNKNAPRQNRRSSK